MTGAQVGVHRERSKVAVVDQAAALDLHRFAALGLRGRHDFGCVSADVA
jgi:hypothetical protein